MRWILAGWLFAVIIKTLAKRYRGTLKEYLFTDTYQDLKLEIAIVAFAIASLSITAATMLPPGAPYALDPEHILSSSVQ